MAVSKDPTKRGGRPSKIDDARARMIGAVRIGSSLNAAMKYAGIQDVVLRNWRRRADDVMKYAVKDRTKFDLACLSFMEELDAAVAEFEVRAQTTVGLLASQIASPSDLARMSPEEKRIAAQNAQWWLSHRRTKGDDGYSTQNRSEITGADGGPISLVADEDVFAMIRDLAVEADDV